MSKILSRKSMKKGNPRHMFLLIIGLMRPKRTSIRAGKMQRRRRAKRTKRLGRHYKRREIRCNGRRIKRADDDFSSMNFSSLGIKYNKKKHTHIIKHSIHNSKLAKNL